MEHTSFMECFPERKYVGEYAIAPADVTRRLDALRVTVVSSRVTKA